MLGAAVALVGYVNEKAGGRCNFVLARFSADVWGTYQVTGMGRVGDSDCLGIF